MTTATKVAAALGGPCRRTARGVLVRCPSHRDRTPSLHLSDAPDGRLLWRCFAGCSQEAVCDALVARGLIGGDAPLRLGQPEPTPQPYQDLNRSAALAIWRTSRPASGTLVEVYLRSRGISIEPAPSLRFHPSLRYRPSNTKWPGMVAAVQSANGRITAVHRTFLKPDASGKAPVERPKMALGLVAGGAVRLALARGAVQVAEGIETALAVMQATGQPTWAALSASGIQALVLPPETYDVVILADADDAGEAATQVAATRWASEGRRVRIARPPTGLDFNDVLLGRALGEVEAA